MESTSPQLLRQCVQCIFILMDATIKSSRLSFTALEWCSPPQGQQQKRTDICQRLLVVAGLSSRLQEVELSLQAIIMCYGLLAPLLQNDLITESTAKVLKAYIIRTYIQYVQNELTHTASRHFLCLIYSTYVQYSLLLLCVRTYV